MLTSEPAESVCRNAFNVVCAVERSPLSRAVPSSVIRSVKEVETEELVLALAVVELLVAEEVEELERSSSELKEL